MQSQQPGAHERGANDLKRANRPATSAAAAAAAIGNCHQDSRTAAAAAAAAAAKNNTAVVQLQVGQASSDKSDSSNVPGPAAAAAAAVVVVVEEEAAAAASGLLSSTSLASSGSSAAEFSKQTLESLSQNNPLDQSQRIKVTLSAPRNSCDQAAEPILFDSSQSSSSTPSFSAAAATTTTGPVEATAAITTADQTGLTCQLQQQRRRQSTAALISGSPSSQAAAATSLNRNEQENELRRIASQRRKQPHQTKTLQLERTNKSGDKLNVSNHQRSVEQPTTTTTTKQVQQQVAQPQQHQQQQQQPNPKQLAIYINGKIRSNSIFCRRSSSSNSFNSILNRFHHNTSQSTNTVQQKPQTNTSQDQQHGQQSSATCNENCLLQTSDKEESGLKLCRRLRRSKEATTDNNDNKCNSSSNKHRFTLNQTHKAGKLVSNLRSGAHKLLTNYLLPSTAESENELTTNSADDAKQQQQQQQQHQEKPVLVKSTGDCSLCNTNTNQCACNQDSSLGFHQQQQPHVVQVDATNKADQEAASEGEEANKTSYKLNPSSMFLRKAMRYYRLWIYCTNITIQLGTLIFILSTIYVTSDYRIRLLVGAGSSEADSTKTYDDSDTNSDQDATGTTTTIIATDNSYNHEQSGNNILRPRQHPSSSAQQQEYDIHVRYSEPSVLLAYAAIAFQAGLLQAIGCFGAIRMKERWISAFWYIILALTVFDLVFLMYWVNRYDFIVRSLRHHMTQRLYKHYGHLTPMPSNNHTTTSTLLPWSDRLYDQLLPPNSPPLPSPSSPTQTLGNGYKQLLFLHEMDLKFDKILTEIIDKIQTDSQCCGISSSLDYKRSKWRKLKIKQLSLKLNWTTTFTSTANQVLPSKQDTSDEDDDAWRNNLLRRVPLVPASCCRLVAHQRQHQHRQQQQQPMSMQQAYQHKLPVILDDSQLNKPIRVPAWSPSMVVEHLQPRKTRVGTSTASSVMDDDSDEDEDEGEADEDEGRGESRAESEQSYNQEPSITDDDSQQQLEDRDEQLNLSNQQRRWLAKQVNFNHYATTNIPKQSQDQQERRRRWLVESKVDEYERVLSRLTLDLTMLPDDDNDERHSLSADEENAVVDQTLEAENNSDEREVKSSSSLWKLNRLRSLLFKRSALAQDENMATNSRNSEEIDSFAIENFRWPNKLQLSFKQYKTLERYLLLDISSPSGEFSDVASEEVADEERISVPRQLSRRSIFSSLVEGLSSPDPTTTTTTTTDTKPSTMSQQQTGDSKASQQARKQQQQQLRRQELENALRSDPETTCAPRSYYDRATIYTHGCQPAIKGWLDSSAHILFVTGFCVLTVLKFCSVVLLRLEIREMIHKIRVLKGMATEYNALHDLEAYLPRPSVCAQAAELTPSGVAAALATPSPANSMVAAGCCQATGVPTSGTAPNAGVHRLGGSFSEAVAAATAVAAQQQGQQQGSTQTGAQHHQLVVGHTSSLGSSGRAASMKAVAAMLAPTGLCPRSSSASHAHLHASSLLGGQKHAFSLRSDLFQQANSMMSRRHTAVSVCPAAAAAAAAAAQHLMSRRGTYVANPIQFTTSGHLNSSSGFNLNQHRHSAHTVHTPSSLLLNPQQQQQQQQQQATNGRQLYAFGPAQTASSKQTSQHGASNHSNQRRAQVEHQSSADSNHNGQVCTATGHCQTMARGSSGGSHQLLSLMYPFKRQSSSGAQSAGNFSLDIAPGLLAESRRSIH